MIGKVERIALREVAFVIFCGLLLGCKADTPAVSAKQPASASTPGPADAYRGVKCGVTESEAAKIVKFTECKDDYPDLLLKQPRRSCSSEFKIGDVRVLDHFDFLAGRFLSGDAYFSGGEFDSVRAAFLARYGKPATEDADQLLWVVDGNTVLLDSRQPAGLGHFAIRSHELIQRTKEAKAEKAREGAKAL